MLTMDDMLAIVKPHNDKLIAEGRAAEADRKLQRVRSTLTEVEAYLEDRADADDGIPNDAMRLLTEVREALAIIKQQSTHPLS